MKFENTGDGIRAIYFNFEITHVIKTGDPEEVVDPVVDYYVEIAEEFQQIVSLKLSEMQKTETFDAPHSEGHGWKECVRIIFRRILLEDTPITKRYGLDDNLITDEKPIGDFTCSVNYQYTLRDWNPERGVRRSGVYTISIAPGVMDHDAGVINYDRQKIVVFFVDTDDAQRNINDVNSILDAGRN